MKDHKYLAGLLAAKSVVSELHEEYQTWKCDPEMREAKHEASAALSNAVFKIEQLIATAQQKRTFPKQFDVKLESDETWATYSALDAQEAATIYANELARHKIGACVYTETVLVKDGDRTHTFTCVPRVEVEYTESTK